MCKRCKESFDAYNFSGISELTGGGLQGAYDTISDLQQIVQNYKINCRQICCRNQLKNLGNGGYIINLQSSDDGSGTHWVGFWLNGDKKIYFDSFGEIGPLDIEKVFGNYVYNSQQIQDLQSGWCGSYVIIFLLCMEKGFSLSKFQENLTRLKEYLCI